MRTITYNSPNRLSVGPGQRVRINVSLGVESEAAFSREVSKIDTLLKHSHPPDMIMDLSTVPGPSELWEAITPRFQGPVGVVPQYLAYSRTDGINPSNLLSRIHMLLQKHISFITVHCTPSVELFQLAKNVRNTPVTSRGGGLVIRDMFLNNRSTNIFADRFDEICEMCREYKTVLNLGTTFRAASVAEGLDEIVLEEIRRQSEFISRAHERNVQVVLEGPGHIPLDKIPEYWREVEPYNVPPMPLGPIISDAFPGLDHITSAVGATHLMCLSRGGIINAVSPCEHLGGLPSKQQLIQALDAASVAAQSASLTYDNDAAARERGISDRRGAQQTCVLDLGHVGCSRCNDFCPLIRTNYAGG